MLPHHADESSLLLQNSSIQEGSIGLQQGIFDSQLLHIPKTVALLHFIIKPLAHSKTSKIIGIIAGSSFFPSIIYYSIDGVEKFSLNFHANKTLAAILGKTLGSSIGILGGGVNFFFAAKGNEATFHRLLTVKSAEKKLAALVERGYLQNTAELLHWLVFGVLSAGGAGYYTAQALLAWNCPSVPAYLLMGIPWFFASVGNHDYMKELWWELGQILPIRKLKNGFNYLISTNKNQWKNICQLQDIMILCHDKILFSASDNDVNEIYRLLITDTANGQDFNDLQKLENVLTKIHGIAYPQRKIIILRTLQSLVALPINFFGNLSYYFTGKDFVNFLKLPKAMGIFYSIILASFNAGIQFVSFTNGLFKKLLINGTDPGFRKRMLLASLINFLPSCYSLLQNIVLDTTKQSWLKYSAASAGFLQTFATAIYGINEQLSRRLWAAPPDSTTFKRQALAAVFNDFAKYAPQLQGEVLEILTILIEESATKQEVFPKKTAYGSTARNPQGYWQKTREIDTLDEEILPSPLPQKEKRKGCGCYIM